MLQPFFLAEILIEIWLDLKTFRAAGIDLGQDKLALQRLREASEVAKVELSSKAPKGTEGHRRAPKNTEPRLDLVGSVLSPWWVLYLPGLVN